MEHNSRNINVLNLASKYKGKGIEHYFSEWLPASDYMQSYPYIMQVYSPQRWDNNDMENSLMDWYIPIKEKEENLR